MALGVVGVVCRALATFRAFYFGAKRVTLPQRRVRSPKMGERICVIFHFIGPLVMVVI